MTTAATPTLVRAIETAAEAREGMPQMFSWASSSRVNLSATDPTILADVDLLKVGTFNGWTFTASDLEACVEHFASLAESGIFRPPVRLDHSWSILQVVGYIDALRTAADVDATTGQATTFLRGDLRITEPTALGMIQRGTAVNRSSELGPYETNSGVLYPLIVYGVAFVDIPAVEGLRPIELSRRYGSPRSVISLGGSSMTAIDPSAKCKTCGHLASFHGTKDGQANAGPCSANNCTCQAMKLSQEGANVTTPDQGAQTGTPAASTGSPAAGQQTGGDAGAQGGQAAPQTAAPTTTTPPENETEAQAELRQLREERAELRREAAESSLSRFQERGVVIPANLEHARTLLAHEDKAVRDAASGLLGAMSPPVALGTRQGRQEGTGSTTSTGGSTGVTTAGDGSVDLSGKSADEVGSWWADLDTPQRKAGTPEHTAFHKWRQENATARNA